MGKPMKNHYEIWLLFFYVLIVIAIFGGINLKKHYDKVQKAEQQRVALVKKTQKAIVKDFASQYAGVKTIKFDKYFILPMGTVELPIVVNGYTDHEHRISYTIDDDGSVEMSDYSTIS
ncbi:hypothetical protein [Fructilactobacillus florum]|uniref:hypothetical protein n=1 Tax=Fructilactobacillus florum TaxID=640331 RepID=UPI0006D23875|nr:hypothetical protein [Fructilactobacillus florum]